MTVTDARVLGGRYTLGSPVGSGGMADVYRATDNRLGRAVAVKVLRSSSSGDGERSRFRAEARTLASLNHPSLVTLLDAGTCDEHPYLVMELVEGPSLSQALRDGSSLDPERVARVGAQIAAGLAYAHQRGVIHRDVKPGNILLAGDDRALLADFGIARLLEDDAGHTRTGDTIGSPAYLSPEQVSGDQPTAAVDVYALGLVLLECLTGVRAYVGTPVEAALARLSAAPTIPSWLDVGWRDLLVAMTCREPDRRPSAREVAAMLGSWDDSERTVVGLPLGESRGRRRRGVAVVAAILVAVVLAVGFALVSGPDPSSRPGPRQAPAVVPDPAVRPSQTARPRVGTSPVATPRPATRQVAPAKRPAHGHTKKHAGKR